MRTVRRTHILVNNAGEKASFGDPETDTNPNQLRIAVETIRWLCLNVFGRIRYVRFD